MSRINDKNKKLTGIRTNLYLILASSLVAFLIVEVAARILMPAPLSWNYPQVYFQPDEDLFFRLRPNQNSFTADKSVYINENGLRDPRKTLPTVTDSRRVLFLGDSVTFGFGVEYKDTYATQFQMLLSELTIAVDVVNAAVPSYNTRQEVAYFRKNGINLDPDIIVLGFHWNDINDKNGTRVNDQGRLVSVGTDTAPTVMQRAWESPLGYSVRNSIKSSRALYAARQAVETIRGRYSAPAGNQELRNDVLEGTQSERVQRGWAQVAQSFKDLAAAAKQEKFEVIVLVFPVPTAMSVDYPNSQYADVVRQLAESNDFGVVDLEPAFRKQFDGHASIYIPYDADHPNAIGHQIAAAELAAFVLDNSLLQEDK